MRAQRRSSKEKNKKLILMYQGKCTNCLRDKKYINKRVELSIAYVFLANQRKAPEFCKDPTYDYLTMQ